MHLLVSSGLCATADRSALKLESGCTWTGIARVLEQGKGAKVCLQTFSKSDWIQGSFVSSSKEVGGRTPAEKFQVMLE